MRYLIAISITLALSGCSEQRPRAQLVAVIENPELDSEYISLVDIPKLTLSSNFKATHSDEQIEKLIAALAKIESPDFGLSPTMSGHAFLPTEGQTNAGALLLTDHKIESSDALKQLVTIGPSALPALLAHLDDTSPTKLKIDHDGMFGVMEFANELWGNPFSKNEQSVLQARPVQDDADGDDCVNSYTIKVGDICLVAIGQITGRGYQTVRYQPTACIVLNSPTHDPRLCAEVRAIWESDDPQQKLFDSLLLDYATRGKFNGESLDGWDAGSSLQIEASMRLLYYFPNETAGLIADRINQLNVTRTGSPSDELANESELDVFIKREVANGVRTDDFIAATVWSQHPDIVASIKRVSDRTDDEDIIELVGKAR